MHPFWLKQSGRTKVIKVDQLYGKDDTEMKKGKVWRLWIVAIFIIGICGYMGSRSQGDSTDVDQVKSIPLEEEEGKPLDQINVHPSEHKKAGGQPSASLTKQASQAGEGVTAIGDSVMVGVEPYLKERLPGIVVEGKVGRQMSQAREVIDKLKAQGRLGKQIILELGTNGPFNKNQLRSLLQSLAGTQQVVLVTVRVPKGWQDTVNTNIKEIAGEFSNAKVVDWYSASEGKDDYFYKDGVHLKPDGAKYYASLLAEALQE